VIGIRTDRANYAVTATGVTTGGGTSYGATCVSGALSLRQDLGFLRFELGVRESAGLAQLLQALELRDLT
jgi:hypothetical protein